MRGAPAKQFNLTPPARRSVRRSGRDDHDANNRYDPASRLGLTRIDNGFLIPTRYHSPATTRPLPHCPMPEGHKTHFLARQHHDQLAGNALVVKSPQGRFAADAKKVSGRVLDRVTAAGKRMFYEFDGGPIVHVHLGRYGKFRELPSPPPSPIGQVRMRMIADNATIDLNGPTTCQVIGPDEKAALIAKLGPDPLAGGKKSDVWKRVSQSPKPIATLLLDQTVVAGVGNIFRAEVLFETRTDPRIAGNAMSRETFDDVWKSLSKMMKVGLKYGKIISVTAKEVGKPLADVDGRDRFRVYGKTDCPNCGGAIETMEIAGRKLYVCRRCQGMGGRS
jgi:endonuclease VIII